MLKPVSKMVNDLDRCWRMVTVNAITQRAKCGTCGKIVSAHVPFLEGTSLGPIACAFIMALFDTANDDKDIAQLFHSLYGFQVVPNTVTQARHAASISMKGLIQSIANKISSQPWIQIDEAKYKRGDGHWGYVWVVHTLMANYVKFTANRKATNLDVHLKWLAGKTAVCDGYRGYSAFFGNIQRCWRHLLADAEKFAVRNGSAYGELYDELLSFYRQIKNIKTLAPFTCMNLARQTYKIILSYGNSDVATTLRNAMPHMFTFLAHPGMPPHNNDAERTIRDGIIPQRNSRHKTVTKEGREDMSRLLTFTLTAHRQGMSVARATLEFILNSNWNIFSRENNTPFFTCKFRRYQIQHI